MRESALGLTTAASAERPAVYVCVLGGGGVVIGQNLITQVAPQGMGDSRESGSSWLCRAYMTPHLKEAWPTKGAHQEDAHQMKGWAICSKFDRVKGLI